MIVETIRVDMITAVKSGDNARRDILKLVLGEVELITARTGVLPNDEKTFQIIRKVIDSNDQVIKILTEKLENCLIYLPEWSTYDRKRESLLRENETLTAYLPKMLTLDEIVKALPEDIVEQVKNSSVGDYGKMTGLVMKYLKGKGLSVDGNHVKLAILNIKG